MSTEGFCPGRSRDPWDHLGPNIGAIRLALSLTLAQMAKSANLSDSWLSQIERGRSVPSIEVLFSLASALGLALRDLFDALHTNHVSVLTEADRPRIDCGQGGAWKTLITTRPDTAVDVLVGHFPPNASTGAAYVHGDSSEILLVLSGEVVAQIDDDKFTMGAGASIVELNHHGCGSLGLATNRGRGNPSRCDGSERGSSTPGTGSRTVRRRQAAVLQPLESQKSPTSSQADPNPRKEPNNGYISNYCSALPGRHRN
ncbi:helix-turn-helix domain-containing protein [Arthrobacter sp. S2(2024)]|uniref:helix-turn-helix domain-containing protein n=1 Tax=Arthrobacter sp. S2(2024) TaxID=3111911 RepID=UPI003FA60621